MDFEICFSKYDQIIDFFTDFPSKIRENQKTKIRKSENPESKNRVDFDDALIARGLQHASAVLGMLFCEGSCGRWGGGGWLNRYFRVEYIVIRDELRETFYHVTRVPSNTPPPCCKTCKNRGGCCYRGSFSVVWQLPGVSKHARQLQVASFGCEEPKTPMSPSRGQAWTIIFIRIF